MRTTELIPGNTRGKEVNLEAEVVLSTQELATEKFELASSRLLRPQEWQHLCGKLSAVFEVMAGGSEVVSRPIITGDFIRINVPGPGPGVGDGYDWVEVSLIESSGTGDHCQLGIKLMPCSNPQSAENTSAHFFKSGASSTLMILLEGAKVRSTYHGRNEVVNNETGHVADNIRNTLIGAGALAGLSELQWSALIHAFLEEE
jgi:hypothetical protein